MKKVLISMIGKNEVSVTVRFDNNTDALKTIRTLKSLDGFKGMKFHYKE